MPNPFPGMNPYLENRSQWSGVHTALIYGINSALNRVLPEGFASRMEQRLYIATEHRSFQPDIFTVARYSDNDPISGHQGNVAVMPSSATLPTPAIRLSFEQITIRERFIEIRTTDVNETLVAIIEVLSPTNKDDERGRQEYMRKQQTVLASAAHLLEIDLLRAGRWIFWAPEAETREALGHFDYLISLHFAGAGANFDFWAATLRHPLPTIQLPLTQEAGTVTVNFQEVLNRLYDDAGYARLIDYRRDPDPAFTQADAVWADTLLKQQNLREL